MRSCQKSGHQETIKHQMRHCQQNPDQMFVLLCSCQKNGAIPTTTPSPIIGLGVVVGMAPNRWYEVGDLVGGNA